MAAIARNEAIAARVNEEEANQMAETTTIEAKTRKRPA